jgi:hypothetical protein
MRRTRRLLLAAVLACLAPTAQAQFDPRAVLQGMIAQLQTGRLDPNWYGPQLWQVMAMQTGGTGIYPQLVALGPVQNIAVMQQNPLPGGIVYNLAAQHAAGISNWLIGIGSMSRRIEYAEAQFVPAGGLPGGLPGGAGPPPGLGNPSPSPAPGASGPSNPAPVPPSSASDACRRFPNLC